MATLQRLRHSSGNIYDGDYPHPEGELVLYSEAMGLIKELQNRCEWHSEDIDERHWSGDCGMEWYLTDGGIPQDHGMKFCPSCGGVLIVT